MTGVQTCALPISLSFSLSLSLSLSLPLSLCVSISLSLCAYFSGLDIQGVLCGIASASQTCRLADTVQTSSVTGDTV